MLEEERAAGGGVEQVQERLGLERGGGGEERVRNGARAKRRARHDRFVGGTEVMLAAGEGGNESGW